MEKHKQMLDREYEQLLTQFSRELERLQLKHQEELGKRVTQILNYDSNQIWNVFYFKNTLTVIHSLHDFFIFLQLKNNINTEKKLIKEVTEQQSIERKQFEKKMTQEYKLKKERWKREMAVSKNYFLDKVETIIN